MDRRRNYKIDLLKPLAMFMVIVEHIEEFTQNVLEKNWNQSG